ncbi:LOW QUALITY PROTEIN: disintegrin and metalloproteinase domain-containing protein 30 [Erethizon dorsatum]
MGPLLGTVNIDAEYYQIEPVEDLFNLQHVMYLLKTSSNQTCGLTNDEVGWQMAQSESVAGLWDFRGSYSHQKCVELAMVFNHDRRFVNNNFSQVNNAILLTAIVDTYYQDVNMRIHLKALEVWTDYNRIHVTYPTLADLLQRFLLLGLLVNWAILWEWPMAKNTSISTGPRGLSDYSCGNFFRSVSVGAKCLNDILELGYAYKRCRNKTGEDYEECDCGSREECPKKKNKCCGFESRMNSANCSAGLCCQNCRFCTSRYICRWENECDLAEYCNGNYVYQYKKGSKENSVRGRLQCINVRSISDLPAHTITMFTHLQGENLWGWGTGYPLSMKALGIQTGVINDGTSCGENQIFLNRTCVNSSVLKSDSFPDKACGRDTGRLVEAEEQKEEFLESALLELCSTWVENERK